MIVLRFTAAWCQPCKAMQPLIDWARQEGYTINDVELTDRDNDGLVGVFGIHSVPTFVVLEGEQEVRRHSGAMTKKEWMNFLDA